MPYSLWDFVTQHNGKNELISPILDKMNRTPPFHQEPWDSIYYYEGYKRLINNPQYSPIDNLLTSALLERFYDPNSKSLIPLLYRYCWSFRMLSVYEFAILTRAFIFDVYHFGNCSARSAYAALRLRELFADRPIQISFKPLEQVDHSVVSLQDETGKEFIYDPLTNPTLVFELEVYNSDLKPFFAAEHRPDRVVQEITPKLCQIYHFLSTDLLNLAFASFLKMASSDPLIQSQLNLLPQAKQKKALEVCSFELLSKQEAHIKNSQAESQDDLANLDELVAPEPQPTEQNLDEAIRRGQLDELSSLLKKHSGSLKSLVALAITSDQPESLALLLAQGTLSTTERPQILQLLAQKAKWSALQWLVEERPAKQDSLTLHCLLKEAQDKSFIYCELFRRAIEIPSKILPAKERQKIEEQKRATVRFWVMLLEELHIQYQDQIYLAVTLSDYCQDKSISCFVNQKQLNNIFYLFAHPNPKVHQRLKKGVIPTATQLLPKNTKNLSSIITQFNLFEPPPKTNLKPSQDSSSNKIQFKPTSC